MPKPSPQGARVSTRRPKPATTRTKRTKRGEHVAFVNHEAAVAYLNSRTNVERLRPDKVDSEVWKLDRMRAILEQLGNPQLGLEIIHIAGSKGKGSVCNMLECMLESCGYTTGVFTSPHLIDVRERVRIGSEMIEESIFDRALERCRDAGNAVEDEHGKVTYFELMTALSLVVFAQQAVDLVVLETGIGGRLDCTNVISPLVCGLSNIHLEHTEILGDTLELIAAEKAGIIKKDVVAISTPQPEEVEVVLREAATRAGTTLKVLNREIPYSRRFQSGVDRGPHARVCVGEEGVGFEHMSVPLLGMHHADNLGLALGIILELRSHGFDLPERRLTTGLARISRCGRLEQILENPRIYIDGAHTPESIRETLKAVGAHIDYDSLIVIFGCAADKDIGSMLRELDRGADKVLFSRAAGNPRAIDPDKLLERFAAEHHVMAESKPSVKDAINAAAGAVSGNDLILLMGSFYIAGEAKSLIEERRSQR